MISNHGEDEFVAVRVQDPRIQNEGSWNSYVDYKIFLHTNSKAFTAKTSCVRRRYSEFTWLKKKLQKNAGLVPVPDLPGKSLFSFSNEDFLERRRQGLQVFLDKVVHMTVCLSDSQLHLFLQTQLPVGHIQDCVQGHTPYSVTEAILTYASSNRGLAQAQEEDPNKEPSLTVSYESMESPAPHQPCVLTIDTLSPELFACTDPDPLEGLLEPNSEEKSVLKVRQKKNHLAAVIEDGGSPHASFYLGSDQVSESGDEPTQQRPCQIETPVEVHLPMEAGFDQDDGGEEAFAGEEMSCTVVAHLNSMEEAEAERVNGPTEADRELSSCDFLEKCDSPAGIFVFSENSKEVMPEEHAGSSLENSEALALSVTSELNELECVADSDGLVTDVTHQEGLRRSSAQNLVKDDEVTSSDIRHLGSMRYGQPAPGTGRTSNKEDSEEDSQSLPSSNGSIVKVSDEESVFDEVEDSTLAANGYMQPEEDAHWAEVQSSSILDLHINGCPGDKDMQCIADIRDLNKSLDLNGAGGDTAENSDFSILETSSVPELADSKSTEQGALSSLSLDASEESLEVEVR